MWVACPTFSGDVHLAKDLLRWCHQLDGRLSHGCLIVADCALDWFDASELVRLASDVFQRVELITTQVSIGSWPAGPNFLFLEAAQWFESKNIGPWLFLEPDAIPVKKLWLDRIQSAYFAAGKPFAGALMEAIEPSLPSYYLAGVGVYPANTWQRIKLAWRDDAAFDMATASVTVPFAASLKEIEHFWGQKDLPPVFVKEKIPGSPVNAFTLDRIKPETVLWHRNKDGSLLKLLGYKEPQSAQIDIDLVLPFCPSDARLMLKNLQWFNLLHGKKEATAVLLADMAVDSGTTQQIIQAARAVFSDVVAHRYSCSERGWPAGCNRAFQTACLFMAARNGKPGWFWMEADAVPVVPDWLERLSSEYEECGKAFFGTVIDFMGHHLNGVSIYPQNVPHYCKSLMRIRDAWDVALNHEITPHRCRGNHIIQHHMSPPSFASEADLRAIDPGVSVFHPAKSGYLQDRLAEQLTK